MKKTSNFPQAELEVLEPGFAADQMHSLRPIYNRKRPESDDEVQARITEFFDYCEKTDTRPGLELLALFLGVSRQSVYLWAEGQGCSQRRQEMILRCKQLIYAFLEQCNLGGKISPPTGIFLSKVWMGYVENASLEIIPGTHRPGYEQTTLSTEELLRLREERRALPEKPNLDDPTE